MAIQKLTKEIADRREFWAERLRWASIWRGLKNSKLGEHVVVNKQSKPEGEW